MPISGNSRKINLDTEIIGPGGKNINILQVVKVFLIRYPVDFGGVRGHKIDINTKPRLGSEICFWRLGLRVYFLILIIDHGYI